MRMDVFVCMGVQVRVCVCHSNVRPYGCGTQKITSLTKVYTQEIIIDEFYDS